MKNNIRRGDTTAAFVHCVISMFALHLLRSDQLNPQTVKPGPKNHGTTLWADLLCQTPPSVQSETVALLPPSSSHKTESTVQTPPADPPSSRQPILDSPKAPTHMHTGVTGVTQWGNMRCQIGFKMHKGKLVG